MKANKITSCNWHNQGDARYPKVRVVIQNPDIIVHACFMSMADSSEELIEPGAKYMVYIGDFPVKEKLESLISTLEVINKAIP